MVDYLQVDRRLGPLFGKQPYPAPQSALMQQTAQTVHTLIQHTDHSFQTARSAAMVRPQRLGRRSETTGRYPTLSRVLHSASIRQYQQRCHREYQPVPRHARRVRPARLLPLPAHAFERPKACFYPEAQPIPAHSHILRRKVRQHYAGSFLPRLPQHYQRSTPPYARASERCAPAYPSVSRSGNEIARSLYVDFGLYNGPYRSGARCGRPTAPWSSETDL